MKQAWRLFTRGSIYVVQTSKRQQSTAGRPQLSYAHGASNVALLGWTINEALDRAVEKQPRREAFVFPTANTRFTYEEFAKKVHIQ